MIGGAQFPDVCFSGAPGLEAAGGLYDHFPTMDLHFGGSSDGAHPPKTSLLFLLCIHVLLGAATCCVGTLCAGRHHGPPCPYLSNWFWRDAVSLLVWSGCFHALQPQQEPSAFAGQSNAVLTCWKV